MSNYQPTHKSTGSNRPGLSTTAIHAGYTPNPADGAIMPPIHLSTTFRFGNEGGQPRPL